MQEGKIARLASRGSLLLEVQEGSHWPEGLQRGRTKRSVGRLEKMFEPRVGGSGFKVSSIIWLFTIQVGMERLKRIETLLNNDDNLIPSILVSMPSSWSF